MEWIDRHTLYIRTCRPTEQIGQFVENIYTYKYKDDVTNNMRSHNCTSEVGVGQTYHGFNQIISLE